MTLNLLHMITLEYVVLKNSIISLVFLDQSNLTSFNCYQKLDKFKVILQKFRAVEKTYKKMTIQIWSRVSSFNETLIHNFDTDCKLLMYLLQSSGGTIVAADFLIFRKNFARILYGTWLYNNWSILCNISYKTHRWC